MNGAPEEYDPGDKRSILGDNIIDRLTRVCFLDNRLVASLDTMTSPGGDQAFRAHRAVAGGILHNSGVLVSSQLC